MSKKLHLNEQTYQRLIETSPDVILIIDWSGEIIYQSPSAHDVLGYSDNILVGEPFLRLVHPDDVDVLRMQLQRLRGEAVSSIVIQIRLIHVGDTWRHSHIVARNALDDPQIQGIVLLVRDVSEQWLAEDARRIREQKSEAILSEIQEGYYEVDLGGKFTYVNDAFVRMWGYPREHLLTMDNRDYLDKEQTKRVYQAFQQVFRSGEAFQWFDMSFVSGYGEYKHIELSASLLRDHDGSPIGFRGLARDVTERIQHQVELTRQRNYLATLHDVALTLMQRLDLDDLLRSILERSATLYGSEHGYIYVADILRDELHMEAGIGFFEDRVGEVIPYGEGLSGRVWEDGHAINVRNYAEWSGRAQVTQFDVVKAAVGVPLKHGDEVVGVLGFVHLEPDKWFEDDVVESLERFGELAAIAMDNAQLYTAAQEEIKERISVQTELQINEANVTALIENTRDFIWSIDLNYRAIIINTSCRDGFGALYQTPVDVGSDMLALVGAHERQVWKDRYDRALLGEPFVAEERYEVNGSLLELEISFNPIVRRDGIVTGVSCLAHDITLRKQTERQLQATRDAAESANRAKSAFLANMSHELRTPLNAIIGYSEMLEEDALDFGYEDIVPDLQKIQSAGNHLLDLINNILDLSKIEAGRMELFIESFDIGKMLDDVIKTITPIVEKNQNTIRLNVSDSSGVMQADLVKVRQTLFNLLSNAAKFTESGQINVEVNRRERDHQEWIYFTVADTGIGMSQDQMQEVFKEFTQADVSTTRKYGGTGLGLTISRRFCQLMGGDITIESEQGVGTTFTVILPAVVTESSGEESTYIRQSDDVTAQVSHILMDGTVLVIDDDPHVRDLLQRSLSKDGFNVITASGGAEGIRLAREILPDAITLDVMMGGMDGWTVLSTLKSDPILEKIPIVMLTMVDDKRRGFALGAAEYLTKPIDRQRLAQVLNRYRINKGNTDRLGSGLVLVVEDDPMTRDVIERNIARTGWDIRTAADGQAALDIMAMTPPNLILLDLMMPEMDGFEFVKRIQANEMWCQIPIIVLTAKDLTDEDKQLLSGSVEQIVTKHAHDENGLINEIRELVMSYFARED